MAAGKLPFIWPNIIELIEISDDEEDSTEDELQPLIGDGYRGLIDRGYYDITCDDGRSTTTDVSSEFEDYALSLQASPYHHLYEAISMDHLIEISDDEDDAPLDEHGSVNLSSPNNGDFSEISDDDEEDAPQLDAFGSMSSMDGARERLPDSPQFPSTNSLIVEEKQMVFDGSDVDNNDSGIATTHDDRESSEAKYRIVVLVDGDGKRVVQWHPRMERDRLRHDKQGKLLSHRVIKRNGKPVIKFGVFTCRRCKHFWYSGHATANKYQKCKKCTRKAYPKTQLLRRGDTRDFGKSHMREYCQRCIENGHSCAKQRHDGSRQSGGAIEEQAQGERAQRASTTKADASKTIVAEWSAEYSYQYADVYYQQWMDYYNWSPWKHCHVCQSYLER